MRYAVLFVLLLLPILCQALSCKFRKEGHQDLESYECKDDETVCFSKTLLDGTVTKRICAPDYFCLYFSPWKDQMCSYFNDTKRLSCCCDSPSCNDSAPPEAIKYYKDPHVNLNVLEMNAMSNRENKEWYEKDDPITSTAAAAPPS